MPSFTIKYDNYLCHMGTLIRAAFSFCQLSPRPNFFIRETSLRHFFTSVVDLDPDPFSGASWIRIFIPNADQDPHIQT